MADYLTYKGDNMPDYLTIEFDTEDTILIDGDDLESLQLTGKGTCKVKLKKDMEIRRRKKYKPGKSVPFKDNPLFGGAVNHGKPINITRPIDYMTPSQVGLLKGCPICRSACVSREKSIDGLSTCQQGHITKTRRWN